MTEIVFNTYFYLTRRPMSCATKHFCVTIAIKHKTKAKEGRNKRVRKEKGRKKVRMKERNEVRKKRSRQAKRKRK